MRLGLLMAFVSFCTGLIKPACAQQQLFTTYGVNEGLVHNSIKDIFQDSKGFIWIATWEGISKYDGHKFTNYTTAGDLAHGLVNDIYESTEGHIYFSLNDGSLYVKKYDEGLDQLHQEKVVINRICRLPNNKVLALTDLDGLYEFDNGKLFKPQQVHPHNNYYHLTPVNDSLFIVQADASIEMINYRYELFSESKASVRIFGESGLLTDSKKRVWIGTKRGLKLLSPHQEKGQPIRFLDLPEAFDLPILRDQWIREIFEDDVGNIWIGTFAGIVKIRVDGSHQIITQKDGLPTTDVTCIFQDREGNIWVGGSTGVAKLVTKTNISIYTAENGLSSDNITFLLPFGNGNMLVGSPPGFQLYDRTKGLLSVVPKDMNYYSENDQNSSLSLVIEKKTNYPVVVFSRKKSHPFFFSPSSTGPAFALKDRNGNFFIPGNSGVSISRDFINRQKTLFYSDTRMLLIDSKETLWVGSNNMGVFRIHYDYSNDTPRVVRQDNFLPGKNIRSLYEDSRGYIWVGTRYHGVFRLKPDATDDSAILHFDRSTNLTSDRIISIGEDKKGCIWLNFFNGLDKLIPENNTYRVFNFSRCHNFFTNINEMIFDKEGVLWLATTQGMVNITDGNMESLSPVGVYITAASLGDSIYRKTDNKKIKLDYRHKQVQFEFTAPGFINEKQLLYSYRLMGSNNTDWSMPTNDHNVSFANLQPGSYRFEVRNKGWNGEWSAITPFEFVILPPFWQTWWFTACIALSMGAVIYWLLKRRIKAVRNESGLKQKIAETEMAALRAQMNPHFIFNCINSIDGLIQSNDKYQATVYLNKFAKLIRNILDSSKQNVVTLSKDMETLQLYIDLERFRNENKFTAEIRAEQRLLEDDYKVPPLIIQPYVENAILHGLKNRLDNDGKLLVSVSRQNGQLEFIIEDNGVGRQAALNGKLSDKRSYGMQMSLDRVKIFNKEQSASVLITDLEKDGKANGTRVQVLLNIN